MLEFKDRPNEERTILERVYAASSADESRVLYDEWAKQYDKDLEGLDYAFPALVAQALADAIGNSKDDKRQLAGLQLADAGCGTGLVGIQLSKFGADHLVGLDISPGMLEISAKTGCYSALEETDLTKPIAKADNSFDAVICAGTLTRGHVGPDPAIKEFVRIVKAQGFVVLTVLDEIWVSGGYEAEFERLRADGTIQVLRSEVIGVQTTSKGGGRLLVLQKK